MENEWRSGLLKIIFSIIFENSSLFFLIISFKSIELFSPRQGKRIPLLVTLILLQSEQKLFEIGEINPTVF